MSETQAAQPLLPPAYRLIARESVGSTNDAARALAAEGAEDGTLVWAREQTAGRGRQGRDWTSPPGNLYCSLILRPECPTREAAQLAFVAALGVAGMVGSHVPPLVPLRFKWPNDVLLGKGKIGGILIEAEGQGDRLDWLVLGVGVNLASHPDQTRFPATDIRAETDPARPGRQRDPAAARHRVRDRDPTAARHRHHRAVDAPAARARRSSPSDTTSMPAPSRASVRSTAWLELAFMA
jgi:BirA family biotin operon repressor/biotin-[acetyl-CoA-carboxylase] ligase